jgi:hypothetical protein
MAEDGGTEVAHERLMTVEGWRPQSGTGTSGEATQNEKKKRKEKKKRRWWAALSSAGGRVIGGHVFTTRCHHLPVGVKFKTA